MDTNTWELNILVETLRRNNFNGTAIHEMITTAWRPDKVTLRWVKRLSKEFKDGERNNFHRAAGSGRPRDPKRQEYCEIIRVDLEADRKATTRQLAMKYNLSREMVRHIIVDDLEYRCVADKWVPHYLA